MPALENFFNADEKLFSVVAGKCATDERLEQMPALEKFFNADENLFPVVASKSATDECVEKMPVSTVY